MLFGAETTRRSDITFIIMLTASTPHTVVQLADKRQGCHYHCVDLVARATTRHRCLCEYLL